MDRKAFSFLTHDLVLGILGSMIAFSVLSHSDCSGDSKRTTLKLARFLKQSPPALGGIGDHRHPSLIDKAAQDSRAIM